MTVLLTVAELCLIELGSITPDMGKLREGEGSPLHISTCPAQSVAAVSASEFPRFTQQHSLRESGAGAGDW